MKKFINYNKNKIIYKKNIKIGFKNLHILYI